MHEQKARALPKARALRNIIESVIASSERTKPRKVVLSKQFSAGQVRLKRLVIRLSVHRCCKCKLKT